MIVYPLQNANSSVISVTGTAARLLDLINTAGSVTHQFPPGLDAVDISPENGNVRLIIDSSTAALSPTASRGLLIRQGSTYSLRGSSLSWVKLIAVSGTVSCSLQVGRSDEGEDSFATGSTAMSGDVASGSTDSGNPVKVGGVYNTTKPTLTNGQRGDAQMGVRGDIMVTQGTLLSGENQTTNSLGTYLKFVKGTSDKATAVTYTSFTTQAIASSVPLALVGARIVNTTASARYMFINNASSISAAAVPTSAPILVPASGSYLLTPQELGGNGEDFATALTIGNSTAAATFTAGSAGDLIVTIYYVTASS